MFYVLTETYLNPTTYNKSYGEETYSIEEHDEEPRSRTYNNVDYCYSDGFDTLKEAELALEEILGDEDDVHEMSPIQTENWLSEVISSSIDSDTTDAQIEKLLKEWDRDARSDSEPQCINFQVARELCVTARQEACAEEE